MLKFPSVEQNGDMAKEVTQHELYVTETAKQLRKNEVVQIRVS